jgi:hypothetical protein
VSPFNERSPAELKAFIEDLRQFRNAYVEHLNATLPALQSGRPIDHTAARTRVLHLAVRAERAVSAAGFSVALAPPPVAVGKAPIFGLTGVAFAHEDPTYRSPNDSLLFRDPPKQSYEHALDAVDRADAVLNQTLETERARRRRATYWVDRILRVVLGFPAYLISLILGFDRRALSPGKAQTLWILSVAADVAGLFALGITLG